jgi:hypothetical protein
VRPRGCLTRPGMENHAEDHMSDFAGLVAARDAAIQPSSALTR